MLDHVRNRKKNILLFIISTLSIIIVTTPYFFMNSQISSEFFQIPSFQEDILGEAVSCENECYGKLLVIFLRNILFSIFDISLPITRLGRADDPNNKSAGPDSPKVTHYPYTLLII